MSTSLYTIKSAGGFWAVRNGYSVNGQLMVRWTADENQSGVFFADETPAIRSRAKRNGISVSVRKVIVSIAA